jgi:hypothetical protein
MQKAECGLRPIGAYAYAPAGMWKEKKEDRVLNSEGGMRKAERKKRRQSFEFGRRNAECGKKKRRQSFEFGRRRSINLLFCLAIGCRYEYQLHI